MQPRDADAMSAHPVMRPGHGVELEEQQKLAWRQQRADLGGTKLCTDKTSGVRGREVGLQDPA